MARWIAEYDQILALDPTEYEYLMWIGEAYERMGNFDLAVHYLERHADAAFRALGQVHGWRGTFA